MGGYLSQLLPTAALFMIPKPCSSQRWPLLNHALGSLVPPEKRPGSALQNSLLTTISSFFSFSEVPLSNLVVLSITEPKCGHSELSTPHPRYRDWHRHTRPAGAISFLELSHSGLSIWGKGSMPVQQGPVTVRMWHVFCHCHCYQGAKKHEKRLRQRNESQGCPEDLSFLPSDTRFPPEHFSAPLLISPYEQSLSVAFTRFSETISH